MPIPQILQDVTEFLKTQHLNLLQPANDGRVNSITNETQILQIVSTQFSIEIPPSRHWYDFSILDNFGNWYPVNIKVSSMRGNDNLSSKLGLYYALTGINPNVNSVPNDWNGFLQSLSSHIQDTNADYWFLVVNRNNTQDIFVTSLKQLNSLNPNGSNPPFQCNWNTNKVLQTRSFVDSKVFLLYNLQLSLQLRANPYISFQQYLR